VGEVAIISLVFSLHWLGTSADDQLVHHDHQSGVEVGLADERVHQRAQVDLTRCENWCLIEAIDLL